MEGHLLEIGVGGLLAVVLVREVFSAYVKIQEAGKKKKASYPPPNPGIPTGSAQQQIAEIYRVVMATDGQGRALIYTPTETGKLLERIATLLEQERDAHREILRILKEETTGPFRPADE